jgi:SAM-dependent methyltransferase
VAFRAPGQRFGLFGRTVGIRGVLAGDPFGAELLLTPVNITRYWEFPFVWRHLPHPLNSCLDVSSPRIFALYVANKLHPSRIRVVNPDARDVELTARAARLLRAEQITVEQLPVSALAGESRRYDAAWSISVVEHIPDDGDTEAMRVMYSALAPGGRLLVTVPVDREPWDEHRATDTYDLGLEPTDGGYFFQRWYNERTVRTRLIDPVSPDSATLEWFGERRPGRFAKYVEEWLQVGAPRTIDDPLEIARHYRTFPSWGEMPGQGVCGIAMTKRA